MLNRGRKALPSTTQHYPVAKYFDAPSIRKLKARLCIHGGKQVHGIDYFKSFPPVVHWTTIRLVLNMVVVLNWTTVQTDYVNAFAQAPLDEEIYMELPKDLTAMDVDRDSLFAIEQKSVWIETSPIELGWACENSSD